MKTIIIEDEPRNVAALEAMLTRHCSEWVDIAGNANSIETGIQMIQHLKPDLVFLDIELKDGSAFEILEAVNHQNFQVIFITAFNEFALKAFRFNAVDYLLKPISGTELKEATLKAFKKAGNFANQEPVQATVKQMRQNADFKKIGLTVAGGIVFILLDQIVKIEAKANYSIFTLNDQKKITCIKNLKEIEKALPEHIFTRLHHSWIVNINYVKQYYREKNGYVEMDDGSTVPVSTRKRDRISAFLNI